MLSRSHSSEVKDWQVFVLSTDVPSPGRPAEPRWLPRLERLAERRFPSATALAEEAFNEALDRLLGPSSSLRPFSEVCQDEEGAFRYFAACFSNAIEDFSRRRFGRPRPPEWVQALGGVWVQLFKWLCLERLEPESVIDRLADERATETLGQQHPRREALLMVRQLKGRIPNCGMASGEVSFDAQPDEEGTAWSDRVADPNGRPDQAMAQMRVDAALGVLSGLLGEAVDGLPAAALAEVELSDREQILLRLMYVEGLALAKAARVMGVQEHQARYLHKTCLMRLRAAIGEQEEEIDS